MKAIEFGLILRRGPFPVLSSFVVITLFLIFTFLSSCTKEKSLTADYEDHIDTTVSVYGPYVAVKLPVTKGVKIASPIQLSIGPDSVLYAETQKEALLNYILSLKD